MAKSKSKKPHHGKHENGYIKKQNEMSVVRHGAHSFARAKALDSTVIALGQLGMTPDFLRNFMVEYGKAEALVDNALATDYLDSLDDICVSKANEQLSGELKFSKSKNDIDEEILKYIYPEDYLAFDYRYELKPLPTGKEKTDHESD